MVRDRAGEHDGERARALARARLGASSSMGLPLDRRTFLGGALAAGAGVLAAACGSSGTIAKASTTLPAGSDLGAIEHVVYLMMENRSFDHYFGTYRGVRGFDDHPAGNLGAFSQAFPANTTRTPIGRQLPFRFDTTTGMGECTHDLTHNWGPQHQCWDNGKMDAFVTTHTSAANEGPEHGINTMGYYTRADLPYHYALADAFTICDSYHASVIGPTHPNRLMSISGTIDPAGAHGGPVVITNPLPEARFSVDWPTMPEVLEDAGISWKVYSPAGASYQVDSPEVLLVSDAILPYFSQYKNPTSALYQKAFKPVFPDTFTADIQAGTLPKVSWIIPPLGSDEHPPAPPMLGALFIDQVLQALLSSPETWAKTVLFISWDENDGFFDHVPPPTPPPGTPGEYLTVSPLPSDASGFNGPIGLGMRVPMIVASPFSTGGYVSSDMFDHTSQLRFLETRFGVAAPNISAWRRKTVGDLTATLQMKRPDTAKPSLPSTASYSKNQVLAMGCTQLDLLEIGNSQPPYPQAAHQTMPTQEPGPRRPVP